MELVVNEDFTRKLLAYTKIDDRLAMALAQQILSTSFPAELAYYLLTPDIALRLLTERIQKFPAQTIRDIEKLPQINSNPRGRKAPPRIGWNRSTVADRSKAVGGKRHKRKHLRSEEVDKIKNKIKSFLAQHPWSNRKDITAAADIPSMAIYNRIISELKDSKTVIAFGEKARTTYALKGTSKPGKKSKNS